MEKRERVQYMLYAWKAVHHRQKSTHPFRKDKMTNNEIITDFDHLYKAFKRSRKNRSYKKSALYFSLNAIENLKKLQKELLNRTYKVSGYVSFEVLYPKKRMIEACTFRDKVVQHVLCDNILKKKLPEICIKDNYGGQEGKGTGMAKKRIRENIQQYVTEHGETGWFYSGDIRKYYYNIDHDIAKDIMDYYYDEDIHWILDRFIDSTEGVGIPLGNQINTIVSCLYLNTLDKFITGELGIKYYARYADNFYLIHPDKEYLRDCTTCIEEFLRTLKLELNPKSQLIKLTAGISFVGFHFYPNGRITLDNGKKRAYKRKFNKLCKKVSGGKMGLKTLEKSYHSWKTHASFATDIRFDYFEERLNKLRKKGKHGKLLH